MKYIVQPGESLYLLAGRYQTSVEDILVSNNMPCPELTYPGQLLSIPMPARPMPVGSVFVGPLAAGSAAEGTEYIVQPEESLYDIAVNHHISLRELIQINNITAPYIVYNGQSLILPNVSES